MDTIAEPAPPTVRRDSAVGTVPSGRSSDGHRTGIAAASTLPIGRCKRRLKTLVVANQKGGVGKTTTCVHVGSLHAERGYKVAMLDLDTQGNMSSTLRDRQVGVPVSRLFSGVTPRPLSGSDEPRPLALDVVHADPELTALNQSSPSVAIPRLRAALDELDAQGYDLCVIDTPPSLGVALVTALGCADYLLSPIKLDQYSIDGLKLMLATVSNVRKTNPGMTFLGVLPNEYRGHVPRQAKALKQLRAAYPKLVLPFEIGYRDAIPDALGQGKPVWGLKQTASRKAIKEYRETIKYLSEKMAFAETAR